MEMGFTEIKVLFNTFIEWLMKFFQAVEDMFGGISYTFAGYPTEEASEEETGANQPL